MDEALKKKLLVGLAVVAVIAAVVIAVSTFGGGENDVEQDIAMLEGRTAKMLCRNPQCQHRGEMPLDEYLRKTQEIIEERNLLSKPPLKCPECGEMSYYEYR